MRGIPRRISVFLFLLQVFGCGGDQASGGIRVSEAWARSRSVEGEVQGGGQGVNSAVYLDIQNQTAGPDRLLGGTTDVAGSVELHETVMDGDVARMMHLEGVDLPAGGRVQLEPGGLHLMLLDLKQSLEVGDTISLFLHFESSSDVTVRVPVNAMGVR